MRRNKNFIYIIIIGVLLLIIASMKMKENDNNIEIENQIEQELGKEDAKKLLTELQGMSEVTRDAVIEKCGEYGIALSDIQLDSLITDIKNWGEESGFFDTAKTYGSKFWEWIKQLGKDSTVEVDSHPEKNQPIIKKNGDNITITIPKTEDVDNMVDGIIEKVRDYMIPAEN